MNRQLRALDEPWFDLDDIGEPYDPLQEKKEVLEILKAALKVALLGANADEVEEVCRQALDANSKPARALT